MHPIMGGDFFRPLFICERGSCRRDEMKNDQALREQLRTLLTDGGAHVTFDAAVRDVPIAVRGAQPTDGVHTLWELLEHLRIAQWDILEFIRSSNHVSPDFPAGYWPKTTAPPNEKAWDASIAAFRADLEALVALVVDEKINLFAKIPHGDEQTILRQALLTADHNAYHVGEFVLLRKQLGAW
jgi:hypothetical protein